MKAVSYRLFLIYTVNAQRCKVTDLPFWPARRCHQVLCLAPDGRSRDQLKPRHRRYLRRPLLRARHLAIQLDETRTTQPRGTVGRRCVVRGFGSASRGVPCGRVATPRTRNQSLSRFLRLSMRLLIRDCTQSATARQQSPPARSSELIDAWLRPPRLDRILVETWCGRAPARHPC